MAVSKVILNGTTLIDTTDKTVTAGSMLSGITALKNDGTTATGSIASKTSSDLTASNLTVTAPAGYYASAATKTLSDENLVAGNVKKDVTIFGTTGTFEGSGGGYTANDWLDPTKPTGAITSDRVYSAVNQYTYQLYNHTGITSVTLSETTNVPNGFCQSCSNLTEFHAPKAVKLGTSSLQDCKKLTVVVFPVWDSNDSSSFYGCSQLATVDRGGAGTISGTYTFRACTALKTLILRSTTIVALGGTGAFMQTGTFSQGGSGGTIYIPQSLYDHLGDGGSSDYKAATNWSTVDGYGTITWAKIEGSYYETHYADGTAIS